MPKVRRQNLPPALLDHLIDRIRSRDIAPEELGRLADWLDGEPDVPAGKWYKRFSGMTVCGEADLVKTFLRPGQVATGKEVQ
jgi:ribosomal protein S18 acetylase RimI-like enzyme